MKSDTTRSTFNRSKHYRGVLMQQGRVQLDADWNEQIDITDHRVETETLDVVGHCGAPMHDPGFHIVALPASDLTAEEKTLVENQTPPALASPGDLLISGGRYYVDGILVENERIVAYTQQPDLPGLQPVAAAGTYLAYIDVWPRHITALEDSGIREVALGGPDTATRARTVWQVRLHRAGDVNLAASCSTPLASWNAEIAAGTGKLAARAAVGAQSNDPCVVAPGAGYRRLENQHYRVEVHKGGALGAATFKWSRDNGSIVTKWEAKNLNDLTVSSIGRDKFLNFASGQWVELSDDTHELLGNPGTLVQLVKAEGKILTIDPATATGPVDLASFPKNPKVRRWDMDGPLKPNNQNWLDLEDGVQIHFTAGTYKTGDYWQIPARTATSDVEWPVDPVTNQPATELPRGIVHHYCRLAMLKFDGAKWAGASDCRNIFPPITELTSFYFVGGDGQEAMPDLTLPNAQTPLPEPLEVGVANGEWPVAGATVRFRVTKGAGQLQGLDAQGRTTSGPNGIASCTWSLGPAEANKPNSQQVEAVLLDDTGKPVNIPMHFGANLSVADQVAYDPGKVCASLQDKKTVQEAIDTLATLASLYPVSGDDQSPLPAQKLDPLVVVAASKCGVVAGMDVLFTVISGGGQVMLQGGVPVGAGTTVTVTTDAQGLASCDWTLGPGPGSQIVEAVLRAGPGPIVAPVSVRFTAQLRGAGAEPGFHVKGMNLIAGGKLDNNLDVVLGLFGKGIQVDCDELVDPASVASKHQFENPVCLVTVDIPYPFNPTDLAFYQTRPAGFQTIILAGRVEASENSIIWQPALDVQRWLLAVFRELRKANLPERVLTHLILKGNFIWATRQEDVFLDGELFAKGSQDAVRLKSGDQRRGGDLWMWFWLINAA